METESAVKVPWLIRSRSCDKEGLGNTVGPPGQEFVDTVNLSGSRASWPQPGQMCSGEAFASAA